MLGGDLVSGSPSTNSYTTNFPLNESPISEGGRWAHLATAWTLVDTSGGLAFGTMPNAVNLNDSYAYITSPTFGADQTVQGTVRVGPGIPSGGAVDEIELNMRITDTSSTVQLYEANANLAGTYAEIVRWNGGLNNFTVLLQNTNAFNTIVPPVTGDILKATIVGFTISLYINKNDGKGFQLLVTVTDTDVVNRLPSGQPGMAFFTENGLTEAAGYGYSSWTATFP